MNTTYLHGIGTALPQWAYPQDTLCDFMQRQLALDAETSARLQQLYARSGIAQRHSVLPDFGAGDAGLYRSSTPPGLRERMDLYHHKIVPLATEAITQALSHSQQRSGAGYTLTDVTHLIAVSCTGLAAPGLDLMLLQALNLPANLHRSCLYFMGCYAALHALKQADAICRSDPDAVVLVVCAELCTLHFQYSTEMEQLAASMLFADGAAAAVFSSQPGPLALRGFYAEVALAGWDQMAWQLSETGFWMRLGTEVPALLQQHLPGLLQRALQRYGWQHPAEISHWALHPGGRKILDLAAEQLQLPPAALSASYQVLQHCGNMSSPTVLFVLRQLWEDALAQQGLAPEQKLLMAAFGPGLSLETTALEVAHV
ncbi:MAG: type III polyketide synthase [Candidatus Sericytochromatia bacterium]|nr:type III polyketide synthase [Candidatus Sericytochromatia bacterium]